MAMDDRALLRDLKAAMERTAGESAAGRAEAIQSVLDAHGATAEDVARLLHRARSRRRAELSALTERLDSLISRREETKATVEAVERFLRGR
jgi:hypothetical protein